MKKFLVIFIVAILAIFICGKFGVWDNNNLPKSLKIYQSLNLTDEQRLQVNTLKEEQLEKIRTLTQKLNSQKDILLKDTKATTEKQQKNLEQYLKTANEVKNEIMEIRNTFDDDFMDILDEKQQKTYQSYMKQREKEKVQREKKLLKEME